MVELINLPEGSGFSHVLFNLAAQGYSHLQVVYSGAGDSGCIDNIYAIKEGGIEEMNSDSITVSRKIDDFAEEVSRELYDLIYDKVYPYLDDLEDWWNNEGGGGTLWLSTHDSTYVCEHYVNIIQQSESIETGKIED